MMIRRRSGPGAVYVAGPATGEKIVAAIEKAGVEFLDDGQGVRLKPAKSKRKPK
jgi:hypothetical protein